MNGAIRPQDQQAFLRLPENRLAVAAVKKLAPGSRRRATSLVTVVGPSGCGKTHLARQLIRGWEEQRNQQKLIVTTASQFAAQLAEASAAGKVSQFQTRYRNDVSLLVCEDIQILGPRRETQQQLIAVIDDVMAQGGSVLITSTRMPGTIRGLDRRLVNRLHGGVCVSIKLLGKESRRKLVEQYLKSESFRLKPAEIDMVVGEQPASPRELLGTLAQLSRESSLRQGRSARTGNELQHLLRERQRPAEIAIDDIARVTAARFGVRTADLKGPRRSQTIALARQTAMYLARELGGMHYADIGAFFNRGNHSTVIHACRKIAAERRSNETLDREIRRTQEELTGQR